MNRLITGLVSIAMIGFATFAVAGPATAASATLAEAGASATVDARAAKIERTLNDEIISHSKRILGGKVKPKPGKRLKILVQRSKKANGNYRTVRSFKTKRNGRWRVGISRERGYVRLLLKGNKKYKKAYSGVYCVGIPKCGA
ncbi:hypothetical protein [Nocardioides sp.]|uniref:hypothetical protein n=1 Tax=Nocardioides sp. TaxID=35761 RepID=UPI0027366D46|nr:hypothetical protein [Nocardioides sp.]MDP3893929.1 hypothetical protein [Nocardioides sp.]